MKNNEVTSWLKEHSQTESGGSVESFIVLFEGGSKEEKLKYAQTLGKEFKKEIYKVDLSTIVSKYIDETEKKLSAIFKKAESKNWILFFDEADALFGKRTKVRDSNDRYANQEVSYLLQRLEEYSGLIIISINRKEAIDAPFIRRFNHIVHFE